jgi:hypothetical protein
MKQVKASLMVSSMVAVMALAGCGGGGGGSTPPPVGGPSPGPTSSPVPTPTPAPSPTPTASPSPSPSPTGTPTPPPAGSVTITGTATFESVPFAATGGALNYTATTQKPVRGALVEAVNSTTQAVVASGNTTATGTYSLNVPQGSTVIIRVKAQMQKAGVAPTWDFAVRDNTQTNALYTMASAPVAATATNIVQNLNAPSGWAGSNATGSYTSTRVAGPFAVLDTVYSAYNKVLTAKADAVFPALNLYWSINNKPVSGNLAAGEITTSFFTSNGTTRSIYLLGQADVDTDEYDSPVVAHEWGHYFQDAFSRDDSIGGSHSGGEYLDMRVAFSEGWGNAWSGMALDQNYYADSARARQQSGFRLSLSTPVAGVSDPGWFKEDAVQYILYSLHQTPGVGFTPIFNAMAGPQKGGTALTSIHSFAAGVTDAAAKSALNSLFLQQGIGQNLDQFGTGETNNGGAPANLPIYKALSVGTTLTNQCLSTTRGIPNKLGNALYYRFNAPTTRSYTITVTGGSDPNFELYQGRFLGGGFGTVVGSESAMGNINTGETVLVFTDANIAANTAPCFTVSVQ